MRLSQEKREALIVGTAAAVLVLVLWEVCGRTGLVNALFTGYPSVIVEAAFKMFSSGGIYNDILVTGQEFLIGFACASVVGVFVGVLMARSDAVRYILSPFVNALFSTPTVVLLPLFIMWLGIGLLSKVMVVFLGALFPVLINSFEGARHTDPQVIEAARSYGARERDIFVKIVLPSSVPFIISGLRLGIGRALILVVIAEFYGATAGLGLVVLMAGITLQAGRLFAAAMLIVAMALVSNFALRALERRVAPWMHERAVE